MATDNSPVAPGAAERLDPSLLKLTAIVLVGVVVVQLDTTIVAVAIDTLGRDLNAGLTTIQWVSTGYLLALALVLPLAGWSIERFGAKRMWMISLSCFLAGSILSGVAWSAGTLISFRILQGAGGGLLIPIGRAIIAQAAGPRRLGRLMGAMGVPLMLAPVIGPVVGGLLLDSVSWRWIFLVNVPVCAAGLLLAWRGMPNQTTRDRHPLDVVGLALLSPALATIVYGLSEAGQHGGFANAGVLVPIVVGAALLAGFGYHALRTTAVPIIDLRLFRLRSFTAAASLMFLAGLSVFGGMILLPLYYQQARGQSALDAGLLLAPQGLGVMVALPIVGRLTDRIGPRPIVLVGMALATLGTLPYTQVGPDTSELLLGVSLVVRGAGLGAVFVPTLAASYHGLRAAAIPRATTTAQIAQQIGASFGTATLAVVLEQQAANHAAAGPSGLATAFGHTFWWAVGFTALALVPALFLPSARPEPAPTSAPAADVTATELPVPTEA
jgi:EmrB/QacA subfamily drug resistance transporter